MSRRQLLSDEQWWRIAPLTPSSDGSRGRLFQNHRRVVEGIIYRYRYRYRDSAVRFAGVVRGLADGVEASPPVLWPWHFFGDGSWDVIHLHLLIEADAAGLIEWEVSVDSTVNRAHQHATNLARTTGGPVEPQEFSPRAF